MEAFFKQFETIAGYVWSSFLLVIIALVYLPAFLLTTYLNKPFENILKEFGL